VVLCLFPQPRQPGGGLGLEGAATGFDYCCLGIGANDAG
jgi:hypothetical protein